MASAQSINDDGIVTIVGDTRSYLYCTRKSTCPASPNAIEVAEHRVQAKATRRIVCRDDCLKA